MNLFFNFLLSRDVGVGNGGVKRVNHTCNVFIFWGFKACLDGTLFFLPSLLVMMNSSLWGKVY